MYVLYIASTGLVIRLAVRVIYISIGVFVLLCMYTVILYMPRCPYSKYTAAYTVHVRGRGNLGRGSEWKWKAVPKPAN